MAIQKPQTFIFIGRSGSGKGTQAELLITFLKKADPGRDIVYLETGKLFREFIKGESYSQELSKRAYDSGELQPEFLTIYQWSDFFVQFAKENAHFVLDGTPRKYHEAFVLDSAIKFYDRERPHLLYLDISRECATDRLLKRGRADDSHLGIKSRLDWFDTDVTKALTFYEDSPDYLFHDISSEQEIGHTHEEILKRTGLVE